MLFRSIVALTANATAGDKKKYLSLGFDDYLAKPVNRKELDRVLDRFLTESNDSKIENKEAQTKNWDDMPSATFDATVKIEATEIERVLNDKNTKIKIGTYEDIGADARRIRDSVFIFEQGIEEEIEKDNYDKLATYVVVYENSLPVATGRIVKKDNEWVIGRVATIKNKRKKGYGEEVIKCLVDYGFNNGAERITLHAQKYVEKFYKKLGFHSFGDVFLEADIEHINMFIKK